MASYQDLVYYFQNYGVMDFLLPFLLVFTISFSILTKAKVLGEKRNVNGIVAFILAMIFVAPHIVGTYPLGYDPVIVINSVLPSMAIIAVAAVMLLLLMGIFGTNFASAAAPVIAIVSILFVVYIFGAALNLWQGPYDIFYWWTSEVTELVIILLIFGLVVYFIMKEPGDKSEGSNFMKAFSKMFEKK